MHVDLCWFIIPWSSLMWPKDYLNICAIYFIIIFLLIFFRVLGYAHKNLPNQDSWGDITYQSPSSKHYHFKRQSYVGQPVLQVLSHNGMIQYTCKRKVVKVYLWNAIMTKHLALTIWHSNIYWNDNVYWMLIDKWCHLKNLGFGRFFCGRIQVLWRKLTEKL